MAESRVPPGTDGGKEASAVYTLGSSEGESARLLRQAEELSPSSRILLDRAGLRPGQSAAVTVRVPARLLQYWNDARGWVTAAGPRPLYVGPSERVAALATVVTVPG